MKTPNPIRFTAHPYGIALHVWGSFTTAHPCLIEAADAAELDLRYAGVPAEQAARLVSRAIAAFAWSRGVQS